MFEVEFEISSFVYEIEADTEKEAIEQAKLTMFEDIHHNPESIITNTKTKVIKNDVI